MNADAPITLLEAINRALADSMTDDGNVVVLGEDVADPEEGGVMGVTRGLSTKFGDERVRSTPISEQAIVGAAIGASLVGLRPVAEIMLMNFTTVAMDMIVNHAAKLRFMSGGQTHVPITIRTMTGTGIAAGGQHCDYLESWFAHTAGIKVVTPSNTVDAYGLLRSCIDDPDPCMFIENSSSYFTKGPAPVAGTRIALGEAAILQKGTDVTVVSYSRMVSEVMAAAKDLASEGISVEVIDLRTISPWDRRTVLESVRRTRRGAVVHEAVRQGGFGAEIAAELQAELFGTLKAPVLRLGAAFCPVPFSEPLERESVPTAQSITAAIKGLVR
ncbi:MAG TPA: alpha-ketoacid dehydrogenase subunit beta [Candidatus Binataceae bacterium]|nr:alpha-ketoacid dehydrogenase subunit beta [Candidatus Binataceae bacterium]